LTTVNHILTVQKYLYDRKDLNSFRASQEYFIKLNQIQIRKNIRENKRLRKENKKHRQLSKAYKFTLQEKNK